MVVVPLALIAAVMGGFGNSAGAILGGVLLGLIETLGATYISSAYKDAFGRHYGKAAV